MAGRFNDREHLVRMAALFAGGIVLFLVMRALLVPKGFGLEGHFRAGALDDARSLPMAFAGRAACAECHAEIVEARHGSKHEGVGCESCHGPLAKHAANPEAMRPERPDGKTICLGCHLENVAKPATFPQVSLADHPKGQGAAGPCSECHKPHHPEIS